MTRVKAKIREKMIANDLSNARQTNAHVFRLLGSTDTKQKILNFSCFGDHNRTKVFAVTY